MEIHAAALTEGEPERLHQQALELLEHHGIRLLSEAARQRFADHGARVENERVRIPVPLSEEALKTVKKSFLVGARNPERSVQVGESFPPVYGPAGGMVKVSDAEKGRRPACMADLQNFLKLAHTSPHVQISAAGMVYPTDIPPHAAFYLQMLQAIELSDKPLFALTRDARVAEDTIGMARIATGAKYDHFAFGVVNCLSPMAWDGNTLESIRVFAENDQPCIIASCSMAGFTSPIRLRETVLQNHAEILTGIIWSQMVRPGAPVIYGNTSSIADMRTMGLAIGAPEYVLVSTAAVQLARLVGVPCRTGGGLTDAKVLDAQAGIESALNLLFTEINHVDMVLQGIGVMESFATISYEKWMMDEEIRERILRLVKGLNAPDADAAEIIGEKGPGENFMMVPSTLSCFRSEHYYPPLSDRSGWDKWKRTGISFEDRATAAWKRRLESYRQPEIEAPIRRALHRLLKNRGIEGPI
jgi:trimethylamine---corrinoid protein Co-methyltransferase